MQVRHLIPLVVLGAIIVHGGKFVRARAAVLTDAKGKVVVKQRLNLLVEMLALEVTSGAELPQTQEEFREFCKSHLKTRGGGAPADQYKDPWGGLIVYAVENGRFTVQSAGPDLKLGTADDVRASGTSSDY